jgi:hypothetical protein
MSNFDLKVKIFTHPNIPERAPQMPEQLGENYAMIYLHPNDLKRVLQFIKEGVYDEQEAKKNTQKVLELAKNMRQSRRPSA